MTAISTSSDLLDGLIHFDKTVTKSMRINAKRATLTNSPCKITMNFIQIEALS